MIINTENRDTKNLKILLAEDNDINILLIRKLLSPWNVSLSVVKNGKLAVEAVIENDFDLILMDIYMPVMDGLEASLAIRKLSNPIKANIYIIALTASVTTEIKDIIKEYRINDYLIKPFSIESFKQKIIQFT